MRPVQRDADVPPARSVAHGILAVENAPGERALDGECGTGCAGSGNSCGQQAKLRSATDRTRPAQQGLLIGHERVRNSLKRQGLRPVYKRPYRVTTDSAHRKPIAPNVLDRRFDGWRVNQAWVADITYIATGEGWLYLACVMDLASRRIVGWSMSDRIKAELVCQALKSAYWRRKPSAGLIMHSDRGSQYASDSYRQLIQDYRMIASMSRRGNCWDNAAMESFFKTLKVGVSGILCVSRWMKSLAQHESFFKLDGQLCLGSMPRDRWVLPLLGDVAQGEPD